MGPSIMPRIFLKNYISREAETMPYHPVPKYKEYFN